MRHCRKAPTKELRSLNCHSERRRGISSLLTAPGSLAAAGIHFYNYIGHIGGPDRTQEVAMAEEKGKKGCEDNGITYPHGSEFCKDVYCIQCVDGIWRLHRI